MKKQSLALVLVLCVLTILGGCSKEYFYGKSLDEDGNRLLLNTKSGPDSLQVKLSKSIQNASDYVVMIDLDGHKTFDRKHTYWQFNPGDVNIFTFERTWENVRLSAWFWPEGYRNTLGTTQEAIRFDLPGLFSGDPLIITNEMLWGTAQVDGVLHNFTSIHLTFNLTQGLKCALTPGESHVCLIVAVPTVISVLPTYWEGPYEPVSMSLNLHPNLTKDVWYQGQLLGWEQVINSIPQEWLRYGR
ncbi:hypothetical protein K8R42_01830 [bacterium]|nr:hypothetical protein [bacterium]